MESKEMNEMLSQAQAYQQQISMVMTQKNAFSLELREMKKALEELGKTGKRGVYKMAGPLMVKKDAAEAKKEIEDSIEFLELKLKTAEKQEESLKKKIEEMKERLVSGRSGAK